MAVPSRAQKVIVKSGPHPGLKGDRLGGIRDCPYDIRSSIEVAEQCDKVGPDVLLKNARGFTYQVDADMTPQQRVGEVLEDLHNVPGNIVMAHRRPFFELLQFAITDAAAAQRVLATLPLTTAADDLIEHSRRARSIDGETVPQSVFRQIVVSASGCALLGLAPPDDSGFCPMRDRKDVLNDRPEEWEDTAKEVHVAFLIGASTAGELDAAVNDLLAMADGSMKKLSSECGLRYTDTNKNVIEHFGYVDGRSQPRFFQYEAERETAEGSRSGVWDPGFAPRQVLLPNGGSLMVYRKLEQNVQRFKTIEGDFGELLVAHNLATDGEVAGELMVGRAEDGTPRGWSSSSDRTERPPNNFAFGEDDGQTKIGAACPFAAHIRVVNPRTAKSRSQVMARRGITYGSRADYLGEHLGFDEDPETKPTAGVGLLFMAYMANIETQFEATQIAANGGANADSPVDGLIGQPSDREDLRQVWVNESVLEIDAQPDLIGVVKTLDGEYFYAPPIDEIKQLGSTSPE